MNLRPLIGVAPHANPKAVALGLEANCRLSQSTEWEKPTRAEGVKAMDLLIEHNVFALPRAGWGYPFPWQSRVFFQPAGTPTVVCTGFVARALNLALGMFKDRRTEIGQFLEGAATFVLEDLNRSEDSDGFCFSYSPLDTSGVVNATLLGAETVARASVLRGDAHGLDEIADTIHWALARQQVDGGWAYGASRVQRWEDSFHTGFNLLSLRAIRSAAVRLGGDAEALVPRDAVERGYQYYSRTFFDPDGRPWYYRHKPWPIDCHTSAVAILTHLAFQDWDEQAVERARRVMEWTIANMWDERGWFVYRKYRLFTNRIPYLRWTQAWMLRALAEWEVSGKNPTGECWIEL